MKGDYFRETVDFIIFRRNLIAEFLR